MELIDNKSKTLRDDLANEIKAASYLLPQPASPFMPSKN